MVLSFDIQTQSFFAEIINDQDAVRYECALTVCPSPTCGCRVIQLDLSQVDTGDSDTKLFSRYVKIDLSDKSMEPMKKDNPQLDVLRFAKKFLACLDDEDFDLLSKKHFEIKNRLTEETEPDAIDAHFDFQGIERIGVMCGYNNVLPFADHLYATLAGKKYRIIDQYCLRPQCLCTDTNLSIIDFDESVGRGKELSCIGVNYEKKSWKVVEAGSLALDPDVLRSALENEMPDLYDTLHKRHDRLKSIYTLSKVKHFDAIQPSILPKVGRNDPCPCGSGKKFKKCCSDKLTS
jgi:hypothetical protein